MCKRQINVENINIIYIYNILYIFIIEITLIDKTNSVSPKIREKFWINKLDTLNRGLNDNKDV